MSTPASFAPIGSRRPPLPRRRYSTCKVRNHAFPRRPTWLSCRPSTLSNTVGQPAGKAGLISVPGRSPQRAYASAAAAWVSRASRHGRRGTVGARCRFARARAAHTLRSLWWRCSECGRRTNIEYPVHWFTGASKAQACANENGRADGPDVKDASAPTSHSISFSRSTVCHAMSLPAASLRLCIYLHVG